VIGEWVQMVKSVELSELRRLVLICHLSNLQQNMTRRPSDQRWKLA
jgi:hypothetical protein